MGLFSSVGKMVSKIAAPVASFFGGPLGTAAMTIGGTLLDGALTRSQSKRDFGFNYAMFNEQQARQIEHLERVNAQNASLQREFAQNGIKWRVNDAEQAGLHPLAVLGANTLSASPSYVGADPATPVQRSGRNSRIGRTVSDALAKLAVESSSEDLEMKRIQREMARLELIDMRTRVRMGTHELNQSAFWDNDQKNIARARAVKEMEEIDARMAELYSRPKGTRARPYPLFSYFKDPYSGSLRLAPHQEYAEGWDNWVSRGMGGYGESREATGR